MGIGKHTALYSRVLVELLTLLALVNLWEFQEYQDKADDEGKDTYVFLTYDQWIKTLNFRIFEDSHDKETQFYLDCIKQYSMNDIIEFFSPELHEVYDALVTSKKMALVREAKNNDE